MVQTCYLQETQEHGNVENTRIGKEKPCKH